MNDKIERHLNKLIADSELYNQSKIVEHRNKAYDYYYGKAPYARRNSPTIVKKIVFEKIRSAMSQLKDPFLSAQDVVKFVPLSNQHAQDARIASDIVNKVLRVDNNFDTILDGVILNGLLCKTGIIKASWKERTTISEESFRELTHQDINQLLIEDDIELGDIYTNELPFDLNIIAHFPDEVKQYLGQYQDEFEFLATLDSESFDSLKKRLKQFEEVGQIVDEYIEAFTTYDGTLIKSKDTSYVEVKNVSPENFLINEGALTIKDSYFVAERSRVTRSDLLSMNFKEDLVEEVLRKGTTTSNYSNNVSKDSQNGQYLNDINGEYYELFECYSETHLVEHDEDDYNKPSKLYQMYYANGILLETNEVDNKPFFAWTPTPIPDRFYGQSMAEVLFDEQDAATYAMRGALQYLAFSTNPRYKAIGDAEYNLAAFQSNMPGSVVPISRGNLVPFEYPNLDQSLFGIIEQMGRSADSSSGVSDMSGGLSPEALRSNVAAATVAMQQDASSRRIKDYARNLATQCLKEAYQYIYELVRKNSKEEMVIFIKGQPQTIDASNLSSSFTLFVDTSISKAEKAEASINLLNTKQRIEQSESLRNLQTPEQSYNLEEDIMRNAGVYDIERYLTKPDANTPPAVDPLAEQQLQIEQANQKMMQDEVDNKKLELEYLTEQLKIQQSNNQHAQQITELEMQLSFMKLELEKQKLELEGDKALDDSQRKHEELEMKAQIAADKQIISETKTEGEIMKAVKDVLQ